MVNIDKLKEEIVRNGFTEDDLASRLGIEPKHFRNKVEGIDSCFTIKEANLLVVLLKLKGDDAAKIFFSNVAYNATKNSLY